jgi:hypothetical protein
MTAPRPRWVVLNDQRVSTRTGSRRCETTAETPTRLGSLHAARQADPGHIFDAPLVNELKLALLRRARNLAAFTLRGRIAGKESGHRPRTATRRRHDRVPLVAAVLASAALTLPAAAAI